MTPIQRVFLGAPIAVVLALVSATMLRPPAAAAARFVGQAACARGEGPGGVIGTQALIEVGWTLGEEHALVATLARFDRTLCPKPGFFSIVKSSIYPSHVDNDTVWQYVFRVDTDEHTHYLVTTDAPSLLDIRITVRSAHGRILYRTGLLATPEG